MPDRPSVLYIDCSYGFGGAIKSLGLLLQEVDVHERVLTSQPPDLVRTFVPGVQVGSIRRVMNYHRLNRLRNKAGRGSVRWVVDKFLALADLAASLGNALRLLWIIRIRSVQILHLNNGFLPLEAFIAARAARIPVVVHLRDFPAPHLRLSAFRRGSIAAVIAVSDAVAAALRNRTGDSLPVVTVHDPVDLARIAKAAVHREAVRHAMGLGPDDVAIGIFGRVITWKGQKEFVTATAIAMRADQRIRAVVVGDQSDGGDAYYDEVRRLASSSGFGDRILFAGFREDVESCYAAMDVVVHASIMAEPFGMVVSEAMAAGKPVIASAAGGPLEVVEEGVTGLLVAPGDVAGMAAAMLRLSADSSERARMGEAALAAARTRFGITENAARVRGIYRAVLDGISPQSPVRPADRPLADGTRGSMTKPVEA